MMVFVTFCCKFPLPTYNCGVVKIFGGFFDGFEASFCQFLWVFMGLRSFMWFFHGGF